MVSEAIPLVIKDTKECPEKSLRHYSSQLTRDLSQPIHPLLFKHDLQYRGGKFFRSLLGYGAMPNKARDARAERQLDIDMYGDVERGYYELAAYKLIGSKFKNKFPFVRGIVWSGVTNTVTPRTRKKKYAKNVKLCENSVIYVRSSLQPSTNKKKPDEGFYDVEGLTRGHAYVLIRVRERDFLRFFRWTRLKRLSGNAIYDFNTRTANS